MGVTSLKTSAFLSTEPRVVGCVSKPKVLVAMEVDYMNIATSNPVNGMTRRLDLIIGQSYVSRLCMNRPVNAHTML
jgi:hypothetical protein